MGKIDEILGKYGLNFQDLKSHEKTTLFGWLQKLETKQMGPDDVKLYITSLRDGLVTELCSMKETPQTFMSVLALFIPIYGLIKKWYADQDRIRIEQSIRYLTMLESFLTSPDRAKKSLEMAINTMATNRNT